MIKWFLIDHVGFGASRSRVVLRRSRDARGSGSIMAENFSEDEFQLAWTELDEPNLDGWEFFTETTGVKIYRLYHKVNDAMRMRSV